MDVSLRLVREDAPGTKWQALFERFWPAYRAWYYAPASGDRPPRVVAEQQLRSAMPELMPTFRRLVELAGNEADVARFLTLYRPAPYLGGCSQAVWTRGEPALVRNYDYSPKLWEAVLLATAWSGRRVMAMSDCLWGALDGINDAGLAVSLAFGGRREVGDGFGCPLLLRYVLQQCGSAAEAREALQAVPTHMAYNVTVVDEAGDHFTAALSPDRPARIEPRPLATNHQEGGRWERYVEATSSRERERLLAAKLAGAETTFADLTRAFLEPPLRGSRYRRAMGTLYTAVYFPRRRSVELRWPGLAVERGMDDFEESTLAIPVPAEVDGEEPIRPTTPS